MTGAARDALLSACHRALAAAEDGRYDEARRALTEAMDWLPRVSVPMLTVEETERRARRLDCPTCPAERNQPCQEYGRSVGYVHATRWALAVVKAE